jgi:hypothetical protein
MKDAASRCDGGKLKMRKSKSDLIGEVARDMGQSSCLPALAKEFLTCRRRNWSFEFKVLCR